MSQILQHVIVIAFITGAIVWLARSFWPAPENKAAGGSCGCGKSGACSKLGEK